MIKFLTNAGTHTVLLFILLLAAFFYSGSEHDLRKRFQYLVFDNYNKLAPREPTDDVVIVDLDENSLRRIGQWPWPRNVIAELITNLNDMGAKAIAFDMVFAEQDRTSPQRVVERLPQEDKYNDIKDVILSLPDNDDVFAEAINKNGNIITGFTSASPNETRRVPYQKKPPSIILLPESKETLLARSTQRPGVSTNLPIFSSSSAGNGHFIVEPDLDGIIRKVPLFVRYNPPQFSNKSSTLYPILSLEALRVAVDPNSRLTIRRAKKKKEGQGAFDLSNVVIMGQYNIPMDAESKFWVHYRHIDKNEYVPAHFILSDDEQDIRNKIKDKIVFIGASAEGLRDIRSTPLNQYVAGVEVHVNVVEQILQNRYLKRPPFVPASEAIALLAVGLIIIFLMHVMHIIWLAVVVIFTIIFMIIGSWYAYSDNGLLFDPIYPSIILFLLFITASLLSYLRSEVDKRQVKTAFGHYISPVFMEELTKDPDKLKLGGEVRDLTVMFTDIRSFTTISESLPPEELIQLMNDFLTPMSDLVMESRGTIDKYMGDAMMAFWNAPLDDPDHAHQACLTALRMNEALEPLNKKIEEDAKKKNIEPLHLSAGIGINTGPCSVGNMGSKQRFAYSALGDTVNLASRLEGQTKTYGVNTLIGEDTQKLISDLATLELDLVQVIGRDKPVKIFTLIGDSEIAKSADFKKWQTAHNSMLAAYRIADLSCAAQDCKEAMDLSNGKLEEYYKMYSDRIIELTKNPPSENWSGVYVAKSK